MKDVQKVVASIGKGQNIMVQGLIARGYNEGFKDGADDAREASFRAGFLAGVKQAIEESPAYQAGFADGIAFANDLVTKCTFCVLHDHFKFGAGRISRLSEELLKMYDTTLHPADLTEKLASFGVHTNCFVDTEE